MVFTRTSFAQIRGSENFILTKSILRITTLVACFVALGLLAYGEAQTDNSYEDTYYLLPWTFIGIGLAIIWNIVNLVVLLVFGRPVHPGANVGCDLLIWLALIVTGAFATIAAWGLVNGLDGPGYYDYYDNGSDNSCSDESGYQTYPNGTEYYYNACTSSNGSNIANQCPEFDSCADQDAFYALQHRLGVIIAVGCAFTLLAGVLHFVLFVWACRDTDVRNRSISKKRTDQKAQAIAQEIVAQMTARGQLPPASQPLLQAGDTQSKERVPNDQEFLEPRMPPRQPDYQAYQPQSVSHPAANGAVQPRERESQPYRDDPDAISRLSDVERNSIGHQPEQHPAS